MVVCTARPSSILERPQVGEGHSPKSYSSRSAPGVKFLIRPYKINYLFIIPARADFSARPRSFYSLCECANAGQRASKTTTMALVL